MPAGQDRAGRGWDMYAKMSKVELNQAMILQKGIAGDHDALASVLETLGPTVRQRLGGVPRQWRSVLSVDDVMQQTYADAFSIIGQLDYVDVQRFAGWLVTRARRNLVSALRALRTTRRGGDRVRIEAHRNNSSQMFLLEAIHATSATPSRVAATAEACGELESAIERLPQTHRIVVRMYDLEGKDVEHVAEHLGRSVGAIYMLRSRAHDRLSELMGSSSRYFST